MVDHLEWVVAITRTAMRDHEALSRLRGTDLPAIALNNLLKSEKYWTRQRCEGAAGGEFMQQAVARSYLHEARIIGHRGDSNMCRPCSAVEPIAADAMNRPRSKPFRKYPWLWIPAFAGMTGKSFRTIYRRYRRCCH